MDIVIFNLWISQHVAVEWIYSVNANNIRSFTFWLILLPIKPSIKGVSRIQMNMEGRPWIAWCGQYEAFTNKQLRHYVSSLIQGFYFLLYWGFADIACARLLHKTLAFQLLQLTIYTTWEVWSKWGQYFVFELLTHWEQALLPNKLL
jgi:hypothetical protein